MRTRTMTVRELCAALRANPHFRTRPPLHWPRGRRYFNLVRRLVDRSENLMLGKQRRRRHRSD